VTYLAWIGYRLIVSGSKTATMDAAKSGRLYRQGFLTSLANPYAVVFFGALFPQFIDPSQSVWPQLLILGATYLAIDGVILLLWGYFATRTVGKLKSMNMDWINRISGFLMIAAAALLAGKDISPEISK